MLYSARVKWTLSEGSWLTEGEELLVHANADQINTVNELVLDLLKNRIPLPPPRMAQLERLKKKRIAQTGEEEKVY